MKYWLACLCVFLTWLPINAATTRKTGLTAPVKYEGGTLALSQGKLKVTVSESEVLFFHGNRRVSVPLKNITAISCSTEFHRRFGAPVLGVVPRMHLNTAQEYFIGLTWTEDARDNGQAHKTEAILRLSSGEYQDLLAALERLTGKKAVNTHEVPTVVQYGI
jgi:hypothetical protein